jgi:phosphate butyryltransferase
MKLVVSTEGKNPQTSYNRNWERLIMEANNDVVQIINTMRDALMNSGLYSRSVFDPNAQKEENQTPKLESVIQSAAPIHEDLRKMAEFIRTAVVDPVHKIDSNGRTAEDFDPLADFLKKLVAASENFGKEVELVPLYGDLLSLYILALYRSGGPGKKSPIIRMIINNIARRKAIETDHGKLRAAMDSLKNKICVAIIAKRYAVYVLATRGFEVLFRSEIEFRLFGTSPEALALQITNLFLKHGIKLADITDIVCGGGDIGTLPDGTYVLSEKVRDESWKRLHNSSLNRGALVAWELRQLLRHQGRGEGINASLCSPLSFSTLDFHAVSSLFKEDSRELRQSLKGYVKVTPLKSLAALLSEIQNINPETFNLLVMSLDELFASVARKIGPRIVRELAAQEANKTLISFDFGKIVDWLKQENFVIPPNFRLTAREIGTGVKEICEILMIIESGKVSPALERSLNHVVDSYARQVAMVLEMASAGDRSERPNLIVISSMMALDPYFQKLFQKIRDRIDSPFTPVMCLDSLEHDYLVANHLFEMYLNPAKGDRRLHYSVEEKSMKQALQVLGASGGGLETFSFSRLLDEVSGAISDGNLSQVNIVLVGADNEDALLAVSNAKDYGLLNRIALIGDPEEIMNAIQRSKASLVPAQDPKVEIIPISPLIVGFEQKQKAMAEAFHDFLEKSRDFVVMKGSVDTPGLLKEALSVYKNDEPAEGAKPKKKMASHTALFVLPDGRFFALSDAAVNPGFRNVDQLLNTVGNQLNVVRPVVPKDQVLKVAIITAVEKETAAIPSTILAAEAEQRSKELEEAYGPMFVEGPLSFDLATDPEVALEKNYQGQIMGDANCLVATDINTANVLYKLLSKTMGSLGLIVDSGGIITAGPGTVPIILTSRGDTSQTKFNSILLALAYSTSLKSEKTQEKQTGKLKVVAGSAR